MCFWLPTFAGSCTHFYLHISATLFFLFLFFARVSGCRRGGRERCMVSGSSIQTVRPQCSVQCPTPGRWNRMHYSCLRGAGFEVSVCIMKAERIRIVMLYGSLVLSPPFCLFFSPSLPRSLSVFLSVTLSLSHSIPFQSIPFYSFSFFLHFCPLSTSRPRRHTRTHKHLLILFSWFIMFMFPFVGRRDWLKLELLKGHTRAHRASVSRPVGYGSMG